jgi:hypothetical protein
VIVDYPIDVVDVTAPRTARLVAQILVEAHTLFTELRNAHLYAYIGAYDGTCPVFDITNPEAPVRLGAWNASSSIVHDLMIDNGIAYLNAWEGGFPTARSPCTARRRTRRTSTSSMSTRRFPRSWLPSVRSRRGTGSRSTT